MKYVLIIEDTPKGISVLVDSEPSGIQDHHAESLSTHFMAFLIQHIERMTHPVPLLSIQMEEV